jgi:molybdopterin converting factor small subunit
MQQDITVHLYSPFSDVAGCKQITLPATSPETAAGLLTRVGERYPKLKPYLAEGGEQGGHFLLVINGQLARTDEPVKAGDSVFLCAQVSGGQTQVTRASQLLVLVGLRTARRKMP